jgi:antitoxin (DNA-binding transcriptional repressor) of toxin-antitoxin stability system
MQRFTVSEARARFGDVLDAAEQGREVVIERRGVRFLVQAETRPARATKRASLIEHLDPAVEAGDWTWEHRGDGLRFKSTRHIRRR